MMHPNHLSPPAASASPSQQEHLDLLIVLAIEASSSSSAWEQPTIRVAVFPRSAASTMALCGAD